MRKMREKGVPKEGEICLTKIGAISECVFLYGENQNQLEERSCYHEPNPVEVIQQTRIPSR